MTVEELLAELEDVEPGAEIRLDDRGQRVLHGFGFNGLWLLLLHPRYYDHPFAGSCPHSQ